MPLVVPDVTTNSADPTEEWSRKLVGKTLGDGPSSETVCPLSPFPFPFHSPSSLYTQGFSTMHLQSILFYHLSLTSNPPHHPLLHISLLPSDAPHPHRPALPGTLSAPKPRRPSHQTNANSTGLLQTRPPRPVPPRQARHDGHKGLPPRAAERARRRQRDGVARLPRVGRTTAPWMVLFFAGMFRLRDLGGYCCLYG